MYINKPIEDYLNDLQAKKPVPGGGSASALTAATGTSLMLMVANYTIDKNDYKDVREKIAEMLVTVEKYDSELRSLIDDDVIAFKKLSDALKSGRSDEAGLDELYKSALEAPFLVCEITGKCMELCRELAEIGNRNLITDTAIAAIFFEAAYFAARFNVYVNLKHIKDNDYIAKVHHLLSLLERSMPKLKEEILEICEDVIVG